MRSMRSITFVLLAALGALAAGVVLAQERGEFARSQPTPEEVAKMMQKWQEVGTPGKLHKRLDAFVGSWDASVKMWMPGMPPSEGKGTAEISWLLGGRWLQEKFHGSFMGMPFDGFGLTGYDNFRKQFVSVWVDSMGTSMSVSRGSLDPSGKVLTQYGEVDEPASGETRMAKYVTRFAGKDRIEFEMHDMSLGEGHTKTMEIVYTRKK